MRKPKIVISGGDGFIGKSIVTQFHNKFDFLILKRKGSSIHFPELKKLANIMEEPESGFTKIKDLSESMGMILLGASRPYPEFPGELKDVFDLDINHSKKMLDLCVTNQIGNVVFASSKSIYGMKNTIPFNEKEEPQPDSIYGLNKFLTEKLGFFYAENNSIRFSALRFAQVFGPGDNYPNLMNTWLKNAISNCDLEVWGDPESDLRTYIYVKDVADACIHFLTNNHPGIFNIGLSKPKNANEIAQLILNNFSTKSKIIFRSDKKSKKTTEVISTTKSSIAANWQCKWEMGNALNDFRNELGF